MQQGQDPVVQGFRERISGEDRHILEAINRRAELVAELHAYKVEQGYPLVDRSRETALLDELDRANPGPISGEGLRDIFAVVIEVLTREAASLGETAAP